ncbi:MAG: hypothetical protein GF401_00260 [Chitinivibrionales bacterium]|nr:hypothetical protein [Chitinivibrionales bacterium]
MTKLDSLSMAPPAALQHIARSYDRTLATLDNTIKAMKGFRPGMAMKQSHTALNNLAQTLLSSSKGMQSMQSGSGQGMMCGLRKLSGKQAMVNAATGELLRQMLEGKSSGGFKKGGQGQSTINQRNAAREAQRAIADKLKELADTYGKESGKDLHKRVKELENEARRLARMLENPSQQIKDRQDRFLVRMIQSTLSMHKEGQGKKEKKSYSAKTIYSTDFTPDDFSSARNADTFYKLRKKALEGNFPEEYRFSIKAYFDSLGTLFLK